MENNFKKGDVVSCGRSGWWVIKGFSQGERLILELAMDRFGNIPKKKKEYSAYSRWCQKVTIDYVKETKDSENKKWNTLMNILDPINFPLDESNLEVRKEKPEPEILTYLGPPPSLLQSK